MPDNVKPLPTVEEFYINTSLYERFSIEGKEKDAFNLIHYDGILDCYCPGCGILSVFKSNDSTPVARSSVGGTPISVNMEYIPDIYPNNTKINRHFYCVRNKQHFISYFILYSDYNIQKIGQYPSIADLNSFGITKYKSILGKELYAEFNRAIGLYSHGVGVGSFVYLRRIIENFIIKPAYEQAKSSDGWDEDEYQKLRVTEKVKKLKGYLPDFLVQNSKLYSIISKGLHELTEDECKEYFPVLRECMEYVLTDIKAKNETEQKRKDLAQKIGKIADKVITINKN